jgi:deoxyribodipyrimidine photo-lyase
MIQPERIQPLNDLPAANGDYVLYWMQASQRAHYNHALEYAIERANGLHQPLYVFFGLAESYPDANLRHFHFMLEGLQETSNRLSSRSVPFIMKAASPERGVLELAEAASLVITDRGYLRIQRDWRELVASTAECPVIQVESDAVVPVGVASQKEEWSAATLRKKIARHLQRFLVPLRERKVRNPPQYPDLSPLSLESPDAVLAQLTIDRRITPVDTYHGGLSHALSNLSIFLSERLAIYPDKRNDPNVRALSNMSPYLHFGQISPLYVALQVKGTSSPHAGVYLEELIVRRELAMNFVLYNPRYDSFLGLPDWSGRTLRDHAGDGREYRYTREEWEKAATHDLYWNAAQDEMRKTGKMHGYMRMYWGKKILEWSDSPEEAFHTALKLNNRYELDGRDPNGYTGVAWCFGKHDRAWRERPVFGKVRYMNAEGLRRKFDADAYVMAVNRIPEPPVR